MTYQIIAANNEFLIVNKPANLLIHGAKHIKEPSLIEYLIKEYPRLAKIGDDPARPGLVHRLDKRASGLLVIARTQDSFDNLKSQFQKRTIKKYYTALVYGRIEKDEDEINFNISRSPKGYKMLALPATNKGAANTVGRKAKSLFWITKKYINYTLLKVQTKTGRTHQIRCHLSAYGHPLVGDDLYASKKSKIKNAKLNLNRIFLVADELEFKDLAGKSRKFTIELPPELTKLLKIIK